MVSYTYADHIEPLLSLYDTPLVALEKKVVEEFKANPYVEEVECDGLVAVQFMHQTDVDRFYPTGEFELFLPGDDGEEESARFTVRR